MKRARQAGFTMMELVLIVVFLVAVAGVGYAVMKKHSSKADSTSQATITTVPSAPAVESAGDLSKAEHALDTTDIDAGTADTSQLDTELSGL